MPVAQLRLFHRVDMAQLAQGQIAQLKRIAPDELLEHPPLGREHQLVVVPQILLDAGRGQTLLHSLQIAVLDQVGQRLEQPRQHAALPPCRRADESPGEKRRLHGVRQAVGAGQQRLRIDFGGSPQVHQHLAGERRLLKHPEITGHPRVAVREHRLDIFLHLKT